MTLLRLTNSTLKGHKLLFITPWEVPESFTSQLRAEFPDLEIAVHQERWKLTGGYDGLSSALWDGVTILMTGNCLPQLGQAPKLQAVQLLSAGANDLFDKPLFLDTDIAFCTANGVHGYVRTPLPLSLTTGRKYPNGSCLPFSHTRRSVRHTVFLDWANVSPAIPRAPASRDVEAPRRARRLGRPASVGRALHLLQVLTASGILGYGSIGRQVARVCTALGMDVHAYTFHPRPTDESRRDDGYAPPGLGDPDGSLPRKWFSGTEKHELHEFLASGLDLLVIALPLTDKTKGLIGKDEFAAMAQKKTFVSNIGRGPIIDTDALMAALEGDVIRGAALDVTDPEPLPDGHRLWSVKNLIVTPHISGRTTAYMSRACAILDVNLTRLSQGRDLINKVSRKDGY